MKEHFGRDTIIEIDLDAFEHNLKSFQHYLPTGTEIMVAVKADAYGHGAVPIAKAAVQAGVSYLGVAFVDEGIELRHAGIDIPILILGYTPPYAIEDAIKNHLAMTVFTLDQGEMISDMARKLNIDAIIHLKVDTGMGRIGVQPEEAVQLLMELIQLPSVYTEGVYTHLATADDSDTTYLMHQQDVFSAVIQQIKNMNVHIPLIHSANSPGTIRLRDSLYNMVRLGISAYGYHPSIEMRQRINLSPVLTLKSKITHIKKPYRGWGISYGASYKATGQQWIATVPVGYGDGFSRSLSNRGYVLVSGERVPIVGTVCMDQFMIDVTKVMPVKVGDEVVIYGRQDDEQITVDEVAQELNTIHYEVITMLSNRIPRVYLHKGRCVEVINPLRGIKR